ncbi:hypothetical protein O3P69_000540 [Scylla paramamosain]|uniref:Uncharacterized protein n=1 Tax=Scylla paramamosain TaxID=85552 RepID=A0AAW0UY07_SCYPA
MVQCVMQRAGFRAGFECAAMYLLFRDFTSESLHQHHVTTESRKAARTKVPHECHVDISLECHVRSQERSGARQFHGNEPEVPWRSSTVMVTQLECSEACGVDTWGYIFKACERKALTESDSERASATYTQVTCEVQCHV